MAQAPRSSRLLRWSAAAVLAASLGLGAVTSAFAATVNITTITIGPCVGSPSIDGQIELRGSQTTSASVTLGLEYQAGSTTTGFVDSGLRTTATFANSNTASYSFSSFTGISGAQSYRVVIESVTSSDTVNGQNTKSASVPPCSTGGGGGGGGTDTPELGSGELLATGLLPIAGILLYRRSRRRR